MQCVDINASMNRCADCGAHPNKEHKPTCNGGDHRIIAIIPICIKCDQRMQYNGSYSMGVLNADGSMLYPWGHEYVCPKCHNAIMIPIRDG